MGCDRYQYDTAPNLEPGSRYVFFLQGSIDATGTRTRDLYVFDEWPIGSGDIVTTAIEGNVSIWGPDRSRSHDHADPAAKRALSLGFPPGDRAGPSRVLRKG